MVMWVVGCDGSRRVVTVRMVMAVPCAVVVMMAVAAAVVTHVPVQRPQSAFVREQVVDEGVHRSEPGEHVRQVGEVLAALAGDLDRHTVELQLDAVRRSPVGRSAAGHCGVGCFADLDQYAAVEEAARRGVLRWRSVFVLRCACLLLRGLL